MKPTGAVVSSLLCISLALLCLVSVQTTGAAEEAPIDARVALTAVERAWLADHPNITLGYTDAFEPEIIRNPDGSYSGMLVDFLSGLNQRLGTRIGFEIDSVPGILEKAQTKAVDGILEMAPAYADKLGLRITDTYLTAYPTVFGRPNVHFENPTDFTGKTVAIIDKIFFTEQMTRQYGTQATIVKVKDALEGMQRVSKGEVDLFVGVSFNSYLLAKYHLFDVVAKYVFTDSPGRFGMAIRSDWPELVTVLNKGIADFSQIEIDAIMSKWGQRPVPKQDLQLSTEERAWLARGIKVRVRVGDYPPNYFIKDGKPFGLAIDLLDRVSERTGIKFLYIIPSPPFAEDLNGLIRQTGPDIMPSLQKNPAREKQILFTQPYAFSPRYIFTRDDTLFVTSLDNLNGKTVAVENNYLVHGWLANDYPEIALKVVKNTRAALHAVVSGKAHAYVGPLGATGNLIAKYGYRNLKADSPSMLPDARASMAVRRDWPELQGILNKVLDVIPMAERNALTNKWSSVRVDHGIRPGDMLRWALLAGGGALVIVFFFVVWNRSLSRKVAQRTSALKHTADSLETEINERNQMEAALRESRRFTDNLIETANVMIVGLDASGNVYLFNPAAERVTGYTLAELQGQNWFELLVPRDRFPQVHVEFSRLMAGGLPKLFENPILTKNGEERVISWSNNKVKDSDQVAGTLSFGIDITEQKKAEASLRESEERFRTLVEQSPLSIQVFQKNGRIAQVNEAWKKLWGVSEAKLLEVTHAYNVLEDEEASAKGVLPLIEKAFKGESVILPAIEYDASTTLANLEIEGSEGNKRVVLARFYPIRGDHGKVVNVVSVEEDITERKQAEEKLRQYQHRLKALALQLTIAEEKERRRIAADLHDHVGHSLALARMQLNAILESQSALERNILVKDISNIMLQALQETRSLIFELSSPSMNEIGLGAAISEWLEEHIAKRHGLETEIIDTIKEDHRRSLDENVRAILFRNVRELLANVVKHARAKKVSVQLMETEHGMQIIVEDNGIGFDAGAAKSRNGKAGGFGLFSIQERMTDLEGDFEIDSAPKDGCRVVLTVPKRGDKK